MSFEICVSHNGQHYFATALRSCPDKAKAINLARVIQIRFPEEDGYSVKIYRHETKITWEDIDQ